MVLGHFLRQLQSSGDVAVAPEEPTPGAVEAVLREWDEAERANAPAALPPLDVASAVWATARLYAACVLLLHRELDAAAVGERLGVACPGDRRSPATHHAVDLAFRHLPDLLQQARGLAADDPLVARLRALLRDWPLSSVGVPDLGEVDDRVVIGDPALRVLYVDRIVARGDRERLRDPAVARAIAVAVGDRDELARESPIVAAALHQLDETA